ncbi:hypothetical protein PDQ70_29405, partial [Bacillus cereus group sp. Bc011]|uniref:hypothetical protein n=1 Tax=Bacillus cereus group sp. Bc011 TaxID=3018124 RepID=UPI0022E06BF9
IRKTTKRASCIINLFLAELPRTMLRPLKREYLLFPTEAGVNTNQSEWASQGQFRRIVSSAEKNSKSVMFIKNKGGNSRLFRHLPYF